MGLKRDFTLKSVSVRIPQQGQDPLPPIDIPPYAQVFNQSILLSRSEHAKVFTAMSLPEGSLWHGTLALIACIACCISLPTYGDERGREIDDLVWWSRSGPTNGGYSFSRGVSNRTDRPLFVDWPVASINKKWVASRSVYSESFGPYPLQTTEAGNLEYTITPKRTPTTVLRGDGEPKTSTSFGIVGAVLPMAKAEGHPVALNFQWMSEWKKEGEDYTYTYSLLQRGDPIRVLWSFKTTNFFQQQLRNRGLIEVTGEPEPCDA